MDSDSPLFSMQDSGVSALIFVAMFFAAFLALVGLAMVLVTARYRICNRNDEAVVLSTNPPRTIVGRWQPAVAPSAQQNQPYCERFVTVIVRNDMGEMPFVLELKKWRLVLAIKLQIYYHTNILLSRKILSYEGRRLDDYKELQDYGFDHGNCAEIKLGVIVAI